MFWIRAARGISLKATLAWMLATAPLVGLAQEPAGTAQQKETAVAEVLSPKDGEGIPRKDEDLCPEQRPCTKINVTGRVATGHWPFLAVAPINASPKIWIQPPIMAVNKDGTFTGMVYLGTERLGAGEKYNIFVFAHQDKRRFKEAEVLEGIPEDCIASDPVTVLRTR